MTTAPKIAKGTILLERTNFGPTLWTVANNPTKTGKVKLLRSEDGGTTEGDTTPNFVEKVESGKFPEWSIVNNRAAAKALVTAQDARDAEKAAT